MVSYSSCLAFIVCVGSLEVYEVFSMMENLSHPGTAIKDYFLHHCLYVLHYRRVGRASVATHVTAGQTKVSVLSSLVTATL